MGSDSELRIGQQERHSLINLLSLPSPCSQAFEEHLSPSTALRHALGPGHGGAAKGTGVDR